MINGTRRPFVSLWWMYFAENVRPRVLCNGSNTSVVGLESGLKARDSSRQDSDSVVMTRELMPSPTESCFILTILLFWDGLERGGLGLRLDSESMAMTRTQMRWTWLQHSTPTCLYFDFDFISTLPTQYTTFIVYTCTYVTQRQPRQLWLVLNRKDNPVTALRGRNDPHDWHQTFSQFHLRFGPRMVLKQQRCKSGYGEGLKNNKKKPQIIIIFI